MNYNTCPFTKLSGLSLRVSCYYDKTGLLNPKRGEQPFHYIRKKCGKATANFILSEIWVQAKKIKEIRNDDVFNKIQAFENIFKHYKQKPNVLKKLYPLPFPKTAKKL